MPDVERLRADFPILGQDAPNGRLVYFDNACTSLKPQPVIDATLEYYREAPVCGGRSIHHLGERVSQRVETTRRRLSGFIGAGNGGQIMFTKNATEAINLVAHSFDLKRGDVVITTDKEHNSNWVPWLHLRNTVGIRLVTIPSDEEGILQPDVIETAFRAAGSDLRLVSVAYASNADGVVNPVKDLARMAHERDARILVDAAQFVPHHPLDVSSIGVDYLAASAHKMLGPSGLGFLYASSEGAERLAPFLLGGGTVDTCTTSGFELLDGPQRFEAGLQNYAALWALPAALDYLDRVGRDWVEARERDLNSYATKRLQELPGAHVYGPEPGLRSGILPFNFEGVDAHDVALFLDQKRNIAIRSGAHCVNSYFDRLGINGWARASFYFYNTRDEVDGFCDAAATLSGGMRERLPAAAQRHA